MASGTFATADFSVQVGEINTYEVVSSNQSLTDNTNRGLGTGIAFGGNQYAIGTEATIEVTGTIATSVTWEIDVYGQTATNTK